jgi:hypothetical protein
LIRIHEHMLRWPRQCFDCAPHRQQARMIDVDGVDLLDRRDTEADTGRFRPNLFGQLFARFGVEPLRVVDTVDLGLRRKHDGGGHDRTGERSHTHFVDACDVAHARLPQQQLEVAHRVHAHALVALVLVALLQHRVKAADALAGVALQAPQDLRRNRLALVEVAQPDVFD